MIFLSKNCNFFSSAAIFAQSFIFIFCVFSCFSKEVVWKETVQNKFSAQLSYNSQISLKDNLVLDLILTSPLGFTINQDDLRRQLLQSRRFLEAPFELNSEIISIREDNGSIENHIQYVLDPQTPGTTEFSFFQIKWTSKAEHQEAVLLYAPVFKVEVQTLPSFLPSEWLKSPLAPLTARMPLEVGDENQWMLDKIVPNLQSQVYFRSFPWIGILAFFALGTGLVTAYMYLKKEKMVQKQERWYQMTAAISAKRALRKLQKDKTWTFDTALPILRNYIQETYHIRAPQLTTEEFLKNIRENPQFSGEKWEKLLKLLEHIDQWRFGKASDLKLEGREKQEFLALFQNLL